MISWRDFEDVIVVRNEEMPLDVKIHSKAINLQKTLKNLFDLGYRLEASSSVDMGRPRE